MPGILTMTPPALQPFSVNDIDNLTIGLLVTGEFRVTGSDIC
ncbi:MAG: hypothetical protein N0E44_11920 [Candidatus Thiodiazotropha lotti]|nr:hypothetical protein [Candidatus Thiodiazotropha lotti]